MEGGRREISDSYFYDKVYSGINIKQRSIHHQSSPITFLKGFGVIIGYYRQTYSTDSLWLGIHASNAAVAILSS